jgi:hypothetical protein
LGRFCAVLLRTISAEYPVNVTMAFLIDPLGSPDPAIKYTVNAAFALGVAVLLLVAARRVPAAPVEDSNTLSSARTPTAECARPD